jgi:hypothetical protein
LILNRPAIPSTIVLSDDRAIIIRLTFYLFSVRNT